MGAGVNQCSRSNGTPFSKKMENWPPSGPSQKRSSPPKTLMCLTNSPEATSSRLIQPKLRPSGPVAELVMTRPCIFGRTATWPWPERSFRITTSVYACRNAMSSRKPPSCSGLRAGPIPDAG